MEEWPSWARATINNNKSPRPMACGRDVHSTSHGHPEPIPNTQNTAPHPPTSYRVNPNKAFLAGPLRSSGGLARVNHNPAPHKQNPLNIWYPNLIQWARYFIIFFVTDNIFFGWATIKFKNFSKSILYFRVAIFKKIYL